MDTTEKDFKDRYGRFESYMSRAKNDIVNQEYAYALGEIRKAIAPLAEIFLGEFCNNENDALSIIKGEKEFYYGNLQERQHSDKAEGKYLIIQAKCAFEQSPKKPTVKNKEYDITNSIMSLNTSYNDGSPETHGSSTQINVENGARMAYYNITTLLERIKDLKGKISQDTIKLAEKFEDENQLKLPIQVNEYDNSEEEVTIANEKNILADKLRDIQQSYARAIAILPEDFNKIADQQVLEQLFRIPFALIIDYNQNMKDGFFKNLSTDISVNKIIEPEGSYKFNVVDGEHRTNWMFPTGDYDNYRTLNRKPRVRQKYIEDILKEYIKIAENKKLILFVLIKDTYEINKLVERLIDNIDKFIETFEIIIFNDYDNNKFNEWKDKITNLGSHNKENYINSIHNWHLNAIDLLDTINENVSSIATHEIPFALSVMGKTIPLTQEERTLYVESGLEFIDTNIERSNDRWDFYSGAEITWKEIQHEFAATRSKFENYKNLIIKCIKTLKGVEIIPLVSEPGAGATTLSRQLAYSIDRLSRDSKDFQCTAVSIKRHTKTLRESLEKLSEKVSNTAIMVILESYMFSGDSLQDLISDLNKAQKNILFLQIKSDYTPSKQSIRLNSQLTPIEHGIFMAKYERQLNEEKRAKLANLKPIQPIDFPLVIHDEQVSGNLNKYINSLMTELPEELQKVCAYIAFIAYYTKRSISLSLMRPLLGEKKRLDNYDSDTQKRIKKIILEVAEENIQHSNMWRPRYSVFSKFILNSYFNLDDDNSDWKTPYNIHVLANEYIDLCAKTALSEEVENTLIALFTERNSVDFRNSDEDQDLVQKFSALVEDLDDYEYVTKLMEKLINAYPNNPYFLAHYARYLFEWAYEISKETGNIDEGQFSRAEDYINHAIICNDKSDKIYHIQGMLYLRKIQILLNKVKRDKTSGIFDNDALTKVVEKLVICAADAFNKSEEYAPTSTYGYVCEGKTYRDSFKIIKELCGDYEFCEKNPWNEYLESFNDAISRLIELLNSKDLYTDERLKADFDSLLRFHMEIVGSNEYAVESYYNKFKRNDINKNDKLRYSKLYYWAIIYSEKKRNGLDKTEDREILQELPDDTRKRLKEVLEKAIEYRNTTAFKQLHELKLTDSSTDYSIDDAIMYWKRCINICQPNQLYNFDYINALYMLAAYHSCRYILAGLNNESPNRNDEREAIKYFKLAKEEAHKNGERSTIRPYYFLGIQNDANILIPANRPYHERRRVNCEIKSIKEDGKGVATIVPCGIEASFRNSAYRSQDVGKKINKQIGFKYEGLGLYDEQESETEPYNPQGDTDSITNTNDANKNELATVPIVETTNEVITQNENNDTDYKIGTYHEGRSKYEKAYIIDDNGYKWEVKTKGEDYIDDESRVRFKPKEEPRKNNPKYRTAYEVKMLD